MDLGFVLATGGGDLARIVALARAARRRRWAVALFAMHDGVRALADAPALVQALADADCDVIGCATSADALGVDLAALAVVRPPREEDMAVAADWLARSGAFGLIVLDLGVLDLGAHAISLPSLVRLASLAQRHDLAIVCLTEKPCDRPSLGSLVSLRGDARRRRRAAGEFECELEVAKDKRRSRPWRHSEVRRGATGLR